jgi:hypothetical protein
MVRLTRDDLLGIPLGSSVLKCSTQSSEQREAVASSVSTQLNLTGDVTSPTSELFSSTHSIG